MTLRTALRALRRNKLRSALTTLGIVIGVASVIAMVSIGQGADAAVQAQIQSLGTNLLMIVPGASTSGGARSGWGGMPTLTLEDARAIAEEAQAIDRVTYIKRQVAQVVYGDRNWSTVVQGSSPTFLEVRDWGLTSGRFFDEREDSVAARVAVLGATVVLELFGAGVDPVGEIVRVKGVPFLVIGVLAAKGQTSWGQDQDDTVMIPFAAAERRVLGGALLGMVDQIHVKASAPDRMTEATDEITSLLHQRHRIQPREENDFTVRNLADMAEASKSATQVMTNLLLSVASISLLVGGIGIMNILLVSVTERTREIGIRMAVGAKARHILFQFLVEATLLSLGGGIAGSLLGIAAATTISRFAGWPTHISPASIVAAVGFSAAVGIFFGFYPARRAAKLDPISALRYE